MSAGNADLLIVGGGAGGLMAAVRAGETTLRCALLERKHRPGLKLLMCGNNRCNITHAASVTEMVSAYGEPAGGFLTPALELLSPSGLRSWFEERGLPTTVHADDRVFPRSENADHVLHCFLDCLRDLEVPVLFNCVVSSIERVADGFEVCSERLVLRSRYLLLATGGVSYPKTGSVGDGQRFAKALGHRIEPYRAGLAGIEFAEAWLHPREDISLPDTRVALFSGGRETGTTEGEILLSSACARGPAMVNASRLIARKNLTDVRFSIDLVPSRDETEIAGMLRQGGARDSSGLPRALRAAGLLPPDLVDAFVSHVSSHAAGSVTVDEAAHALKHWSVTPRKLRPLKEAMVTVGGVALDEVDPSRMESRVCPGLFFAGEILDIDGPTGGYNLHAAFATAQLAVKTIASDARAKPKPYPTSRKRSGSPSKGRRPGNRSRPQRRGARGRSPRRRR